MPYVWLSRLSLVLVLGISLLSCAPPAREPASGGPEQSKLIPEDEPVISPPVPPNFENVNYSWAIALPVAEGVDRQYSRYQELLRTRRPGSVAVDSCDSRVANTNTFAEKIAYSVVQHFTARDPQLFHLANIFNLPDNPNSMAEVSLVSHPLCQVSTETLKKTIGSGKVPSSKTIQQINNFSSQANKLRELYLAGSVDAGVQLAQMWSKMFMCLAYTESLTSADSTKSKSVAKKYAPAGFEKPPGVLFYEDAAQPAASRLNIGLYQFTPSAGGNIFTCIKQWNRINPACSLSTRSTQAQMILSIGSSEQTFNAFCGVEKVIDSFGVQVNSRSSSRSHPGNLLANNKLKPSADRCVSFAFNGQSYNHFGPFQNTTGSNLASLMSCVAAK